MISNFKLKQNQNYDSKKWKFYAKFYPNETNERKYSRNDGVCCKTEIIGWKMDFTSSETKLYCQEKSVEKMLK